MRPAAAPRSSRPLVVAVGLVLLLAVCVQCSAQTWQDKLASNLPLFGHRNWICVVDSAYPLQARPAIETVCTDGDQLEVVGAVLKAVQGCRHVRPVIFTDKELGFLTDDLAPGIADYRKALKAQLGPLPVNEVLHEGIIKMLDQAAQTFRVLILKTNMTLPYTSVFLRLDCGYWPAESEAKLRQAMKGPK